MRNKGFSLVELLIVLSVMAALIAVMIPIGMNAIRKAKAVKVARNLKILAETTQNIIMINGMSEIDNTEKIYDYVKNITEDYKIRIFDTGSGNIYVCSLYTETDVSTKLVCEILPDIKYANEDYKVISETPGHFYMGQLSYISTKKPVMAPLNSLYYPLTVAAY
ncbi:MAG: type II secretion system protein [Kosmotogaceae bacterium]